MARLDELRLMTRVARLYYEGGLKQPEIATRLRLSQPKVSRLLKQALDDGIVRITVRIPTGTHPDLEERLEVAFGLQDAVVVDVADDDEQVVRGLGAAAAFSFETTVRSGDIIGISSWTRSTRSPRFVTPGWSRSSVAWVTRLPRVTRLTLFDSLPRCCGAVPPSCRRPESSGPRTRDASCSTTRSSRRR